MASSFGIDPNWYTDSGVTDHIIGALNKLTMHDPYFSNDQIHAINGSGMDITRVGKAIIPTPIRNLVLNHVLHVPSAHKNLIFVYRFTLDNDTFIEFHPYFFLIKDRKTKRVLLHGPCKGGLYPLPPSTSKFRKLVFSAIKIPINRWHSRLGHFSRDIVHRVILKNNLPCAQSDNSSESVCEACACAKAHQLPYSISSRTSSTPLELVHSNVWGPAIDSFGRKKYYVILLMIIVSLHGFTYNAKNLRPSNTFLNFSSLLNVCLIVRSLPFNDCGGKYENLNSFFSDNRDLSSSFLPSHSTAKRCC
jgi:hypothetical protein